MCIRDRSQWEDVIEGWRAATKDDIVLAQMLYAEAAKADVYKRQI